MQDGRAGEILNELARIHHVRPEDIRKDMEEAMRVGMETQDPNVRMRWQQIPKSGDTLTLEEFLEYLLNLTREKNQ